MKQDRKLKKGGIWGKKTRTGKFENSKNIERHVEEMEFLIKISNEKQKSNKKQNETKQNKSNY